MAGETYVAERPCKRGHVPTIRYVSTGACLSCNQMMMPVWRNRNAVPHAAKPLVSIEDARSKFCYDPETGVLSHRCNARKIGTPDGRGHLEMSHKSRVYFVHRLVWFLYYGEWPPSEIDHINGNGEDNRMSNLRLASQAENAKNSRRPKNNKSGYKGVCFEQQTGKWKAQIKVNGRHISLGRFPTPELAHESYKDAAIRYHGEFANFG